MTTTEEQLALMDWLRKNGGIGIGCGGDDDLADHLPEGCHEEWEEYHNYFEVELRKAGPSGASAYLAIRQAAKAAWRDLHAEDYEGPAMQGRVQDYFYAAATTGFAGPPESLGATGISDPKNSDNRKKHPGGSRRWWRPRRGIPWPWRN